MELLAVIYKNKVVEESNARETPFTKKNAS